MLLNSELALSNSKTRSNFQKSVKFVAKDPYQSHNFNNNPRKLDAGIEQFGLNSSYPLTRSHLTLRSRPLDFQTEATSFLKQGAGSFFGLNDDWVLPGKRPSH